VTLSSLSQRVLVGLALAWPALHASAAGCEAYLATASADGIVSAQVDAAQPEIANVEMAVSCLRAVASRDATALGIKLEMAPGIYRVRTPLVFDRAWLGSRKLIIVAPKGGAVLSGAVALGRPIREEDLTGAQGPLRIEQMALPAELVAAMSALWVPQHGQRHVMAPPEIIVDGQMGRLARYPQSGFIQIKDMGNGLGFDRPSDFPATGHERVLGHGFWFYDWADGRVELNASPLQQGHLQVNGAPPKYGMRTGGRFYLYGAPAFLAKPGDYALPDVSTGWVRVATHPGHEAAIEVTQAQTVIQIKGLSRAVLQGFAVVGARQNGILAMGDHLQLRQLQVKNIGGVGIQLQGSDNLISEVEVSDTGGTAIEISGGDRKTLVPGRSGVEHSRIHDFGRLIWSSVPGVRIDGVGNRIVDCDIYNGPHSGIFYFGNDHLIQGNEVHDVAQVTGDVGAIYTGRDWAGRGHRIVGNYVHDVQGVGKQGASAFYLDDQASGVEIADNIAWRVHRGILVGGGKDNVIRHNIIVANDEALQFDARGLTWQRAQSQPGGELWKHLQAVPYQSQVYLQRYPQLRGIDAQKPGVPTGNQITQNILVGRWRTDAQALQASPLGINWESRGVGLSAEVLQLKGEAPAPAAFKVDWERIAHTVAPAKPPVPVSAQDAERGH
jgi:hypothetical protein